MVTRRSTAYAPGTGTIDRYRTRKYTVPFNNINEPGTYYFHPTGMLVRIPPNAVIPGHSPTINLCWVEETYCTKISDDPWMPLGKARETCANWDLEVNF